jgi:hypothetical protein
MDCLAISTELRKQPPLKHWGEHDLPRWLRDGCKCVYCDRDLLESYETAYYDSAYDHLLPKSAYKELESHDLNLVLCCWPCNKMKASWDANKWSREGKPQDAVYDISKPFDELMRTTLIERVRVGISYTNGPYKTRFVEEQRLLREALRACSPAGARAAAGSSST